MFLLIVLGKLFYELWMMVVIFGSDWDFWLYKLFYNGKFKENLVGVFCGVFDEVVIVMFIEWELEWIILMIYYEYVYLFMYVCGYCFLLWLNEGVVELYEIIEFELECVMVGWYNLIYVMKLNCGMLMLLV